MIDKYQLEATIEMLEAEIADPSIDCRINLHRMRECIMLLKMIQRKILPP